MGADDAVGSEDVVTIDLTQCAMVLVVDRQGESYLHVTEGALPPGATVTDILRTLARRFDVEKIPA